MIQSKIALTQGRLWRGIVYVEGTILVCRYIYQFEEIQNFITTMGDRTAVICPPDAVDEPPYLPGLCLTVEELGLIEYSSNLRFLQFLPLVIVLCLSLLTQNAYEFAHQYYKQRNMEADRLHFELSNGNGIAGVGNENMAASSSVVHTNPAHRNRNVHADFAASKSSLGCLQRMQIFIGAAVSWAAVMDWIRLLKLGLYHVSPGNMLKSLCPYLFSRFGL